MKASELIEELQTQIRNSGDHEVMIYDKPFDCMTTVENMRVEKFKFMSSDSEEFIIHLYP